MPDVLEMPYRPNIIGAGQPEEFAYSYRLGGPTCLAGGVIGDYSFAQPLKVGDKVVFCDMRNTSVVSKDINGDKIIEIPIVNLMPGYNGATTDDAAYVTNWHRYDTKTNTLIRVMSMVLNYSDGYWFLIPDMWRGKVTTQTDTATRTITFYKWLAASKKNTPGKLGAALLKIQVFTEKEWEDGTGTEGFFELLDSGGMVFAADAPLPGDALSLSASDVKVSFKLINQDLN